MKANYFLFFLLLTGKLSYAQIQFQKTYGGPYLDWARCVTRTFDGGYVATGQTRTTPNGFDDVLVIRIDSTGDTLWTKIIGGSNTDQGTWVRQTSDSGFIVSGWTTSYGAGDWDAFLIKLDATGNVDWTKTYGGIYGDLAKCVEQTSDGGYMIGGWTTSFGAGDFDFYLIKTDTVGNVIWSKTYGGPYTETGYSARPTLDGGFVMIGMTGSYGAGLTDVFLVKTDSAGNIQWTRTFGDINYDWGTSVEQTADSGYIIGGYYDCVGQNHGDIYLLKTDKYGIEEWSKTYSGGPINNSNEGYFAVQTSDGGYALTGINYTNNGVVIILLKTDSAGTTQWSKNYGNAASIGFVETTDGGFIIAGGYNFYDDFLLVKTDDQGNSSCTSLNFNINEVPHSTQSATAIALSDSGCVSINQVCATGSGIIISSPCSGTNIVENSNEQNLFVYPNPSDGNFRINFPNFINNGTIRIFDVLGNLIYENEVRSSTDKNIDLSNITSKTLFLFVSDNDQKFDAIICIQ